MDFVHEASADELRAVLFALCKDMSIETKVKDYLKQLKDARADAVKTGEKRKASDQFFICVRCGEAFSEDSNDSKACTYHHGKCAPGYIFRQQHRLGILLLTTCLGELELAGGDREDDFWADHDERIHGTIDTKEMREEYPEGFTWDCCDQVGTADGCTQGHHYAIEGKRMKVTTDADSVSDDPEGDN